MSIAKIIMWMWKIALIAVGAIVAVALARQVGPWMGLGAWALGMAVACSGAAVLLRQSPMGKLTWRNRLAGYLLPWGYRLGMGKLPQITLVAWSGWVYIGAMAILLMHDRDVAFARGFLAAVVMFAIWILYGGLMLRQLGYVVNEFRLNPQGKRTMLLTTLVMAALIALSGTLWVWHMPGWTLLIAGLPVGAIGGWFILYGGIFLIFGRHGRIN